MIRVSAIDHVNMQVRDLEASIDFYQRVFGFEVLEDARGAKPRGWAIVGLPGVACLALGERTEGSRAEGRQIIHFGLVIDDAEAAVRRLRELDVEIVPRGPGGGTIVTYPRSRSIYIRDPDGYEIELTTAFGGGLE